MDFQKLLEQHPRCLQDGQFLAEIFMEHHRDKKLDICDHRTARIDIEYQHSTKSHKSCLTTIISVDFHSLQPSQYLEAAAKSEQLTPYRKWVNIDDSKVLLHGQFNFAKLNSTENLEK
jgi:hypothetical protein